MGENVHFSSKTDLWSTPQDFFDELDAEYGFTTDVCATPDNTKCGHYYTEDDDGLVEIKCPSAHAKHLAALLTGAHAKEYRWQLQHQLWVSGREWVDIASYYPGLPEHLRLAITRVERNAEDIKALEAECLAAHDEIEATVAELQKLDPMKEAA